MENYRQGTTAQYQSFEDIKRKFPPISLVKSTTEASIFNERIYNDSH